MIVELNRYDLSKGMARTMAPMLIGRPMEGIWHTGIVVFGNEYYFDGGVGIVVDPHPGATRFGQPYRSEQLGKTQKTAEEFGQWIGKQHSTTFGPNDYNLLERNCNHFSQAACQFLLGTDIPSEVREMIPMLLSTPLGTMLRPALEKMVIGPETTDAHERIISLINNNSKPPVGGQHP